MTWHVILKEELIVTHIFLVTLTESSVFGKKDNTNVGAKVEPHTIYTLNVFLTHSPFPFYDCGVHTFSYDCGLNSSKIKGKLSACSNNAPFRYP